MTEFKGESAALIDVRMPPKDVVNAISRCNYVISSSLHGLIVADSLKIPNLWVKSSDSIIGGEFKYHDYYSCFNVERRPRVLGCKDSLSRLVCEASSLPKDCLLETKKEITSSYQKFSDLVMKNN